MMIDGGDLSCGELLLTIHRRIRELPDGTLVTIRALDPVAPIDLPYWCHLTGHEYLGQQPTDSTLFDIRIAQQPGRSTTTRPHAVLTYLKEHP